MCHDRRHRKDRSNFCNFERWRPQATLSDQGIIDENAQHLVKSAFVLLIGCATVEYSHAQSDVTKTFVDRLIEQVTRLDRSCAKEIKKYCSTVTPGEGRVIYCMQAHEDKLPGLLIRCPGGCARIADIQRNLEGGRHCLSGRHRQQVRRRPTRKRPDSGMSCRGKG